MKLYVGNPPYDISDDQLNEMFTKFGTPDSAKVITDRDTGRSKGFGFVEFSNGDQAKQALSLNGTDFGGRSLTVNEARPKNDNGGRSRYCSFSPPAFSGRGLPPPFFFSPRAE